MFYFNGDEVQAPVLTKNERELVRKLKDEWFGDGNNCDMISTDYGAVSYTHLTLPTIA